MRRRSLAVVLGACAASCALFPDLGELTTASDAASDVIVDTQSEISPPSDASSDAPVDAGCPTISRVQTAAYVMTASTNQSVQVSLGLTQGDLVVALIGAQFPGTLTLSDTASTPWTLLPEADNISCVDDASPWESRARIAYATVPANATSDTVKLSTSGAPDYLTLTVVEYAASSGALTYTASNANTATASTSTISLPPLTTSGCNNLVVAMLADEDPSGDQWTPFNGYDVISSAGDWSFATVEDLSAPKGSSVAGATHQSSEACWATAGASFAAQ